MIWLDLIFAIIGGILGTSLRPYIRSQTNNPTTERLVGDAIGSFLLAVFGWIFFMHNDDLDKNNGFITSMCLATLGIGIGVVSSIVVTGDR